MTIKIFIVLISLIYVSEGFDAEKLPFDFTLSPVYITVSSLYRESNYKTSLIDRELQLHWNENTETVSFFTKIPETNSTPDLLINAVEYPEKYLQANFTLGNPQFPAGWTFKQSKDVITGDHCLPFWVLGINENKTIDNECLKIRPTWMYDNRFSFGHLNLLELFIPGSHNSGCYNRGTSLSAKDISGRYIFNQDQDIWGQLIYGIRYLDIRIGYHVQKNCSDSLGLNVCFYIHHDLIKIQPLMPILKQIKEFIVRAKNEIVILDFHRFPIGFTGHPELHIDLMNLLIHLFDGLLIPFTGYQSTVLDELWKDSGRLLISYGQLALRDDNVWFWPRISQLWGNKQNVDDLKSFLNTSIYGIYYNIDGKYRKNNLWAVMSHMTPTALDLIKNRSGSLRTMAHEVNTKITNWFVDNYWWDKVNIVTTDFFLENNLIELAIASNIYKGDNRRRYYSDN